MASKKPEIKVRASLKVVTELLPKPRVKGQKTITSKGKGTQVKNIVIAVPMTTVKELKNRLEKAQSVLETGKYDAADKKKLEAKIRKEIEAGIKEQLQEEFEVKYAELEEKKNNLQTKEEDLAVKEAELIKKGNDKVTAKFECVDIEDFPEQEQKVVRFSPVIEGSEENKSFAKYTPAGNLELTISYETQASEAFEKGKEYYLDISASN